MFIGNINNCGFKYHLYQVELGQEHGLHDDLQLSIFCFLLNSGSFGLIFASSKKIQLRNSSCVIFRIDTHLGSMRLITLAHIMFKFPCERELIRFQSKRRLVGN
ncbi:hypothetical protein C5167_015948 [Papaver somniferum]|nr:hypothetical protein C5167_015948 [Papaver somniferum]